MVVEGKDDAAARVYRLAGERRREVVLAPDGVLAIGVTAEARGQEATRCAQEHDLAGLCAGMADALLRKWLEV